MSSKHQEKTTSDMVWICSSLCTNCVFHIHQDMGAELKIICSRHGSFKVDVPNSVTLLYTVGSYWSDTK